MEQRGVARFGGESTCLGDKIGPAPEVGETGIDDLYKVNRPDVDYVVIEYKFVGDYQRTGSALLGRTADGRQGSESWILGSGRLEKSVSRELVPDIEEAIRNRRVEAWVVTTRPDGSTEIQVLDNVGKPKPVDLSKVLPRQNPAGVQP